MSEHFTLDIAFDAPVDQLYRAVASKNGPAQWWTKFCQTGDSVGDVSIFRFPQAGFFANMEITNLKQNELVAWKCVDSRHPKDAPFSDLRDWVGTTLRFLFSPVDDKRSKLRFEHQGLTPNRDCYESCKSGWTYYLGDSLRALVETGQGKPYTDDSEDNI